MSEVPNESERAKEIQADYYPLAFEMYPTLIRYNDLAQMINTAPQGYDVEIDIDELTNLEGNLVYFKEQMEEVRNAALNIDIDLLDDEDRTSIGIVLTGTRQAVDSSARAINYIHTLYAELGVNKGSDEPEV